MSSKPSIDNVIIASRGSKLAMWQAHYVQSLLRSHGFSPEILTIKTTGDRVQDRFLHEIGGKGLFVREIEQALLDKKAHLAIHSLKDLPAKTPDGFKLACVLKRHEPTDILVYSPAAAKRLNVENKILTKEDIKNFGKLTIATGSLRRTSLLLEASQDIKVVPIRGNVDTRLQKLVDSDWDGLILAEASLERLDLKADLPTQRLDPEWFVPSAAQGALVIETLEQDPFEGWLSSLGCDTTFRNISLERQVLADLGGDCTMPFGCYFSEADGILTGKAAILNNQGESARAEAQFSMRKNPTTTEVVSTMLEKLKLDNGDKILADIKLPAINI